MSDEASVWQRYRATLAVWIRLYVDPHLRERVDLSGIVQQTLLEAHQANVLAQVPADDHRLAWLRRTLANNVTDELRKLRADKRDLDREQSLERSSVRLADWLVAEQSSPSGAAQQAEENWRLAHALTTLPDAQREALILQHWHGWSLAQIGTHLERTPVAVAGLLKRGLAHLRQQLGEPPT
jgi:RNA polymerase sigma-70 factor (ECF subfamily)